MKICENRCLYRVIIEASSSVLYALAHTNNVSLADLSKSMHWFTRYTADKAHFYSLNNVVTMKIGSRSPNSDQIVYLFIYLSK